MSQADTASADSALLAQIQSDLQIATAMLGALTPGVTIFGSARTAPEDPAFRCAERLGRGLAEAGVPVLTGGGPGIMEAANRGAAVVGGVSVGLNIELPYEQAANPHLTHQLHFHHFLTRKLMLTRYSRGFAVFPGGFGTADELLELLVAFHTDRGVRKPLVLIDTAFWDGLIDWFRLELGSRQMIDLHNTDFIQVVDDHVDALKILLNK
jgi:uncharacterized protein (TIGR00730 family)